MPIKSPTYHYAGLLFEALSAMKLRFSFFRSLVMRAIHELLIFCRAFQSRRRSIRLNRRGRGDKITLAHLALMRHSGEAALGCFELFFLQFNEGRQVVAGVAVGQVKRAVVQ
jgi:hypothetical protein